MALTPDYEIDVPELFTSTDDPSRTYRVDWDAGRIIGQVDAESSSEEYQAAIRQFIFKALQSKRYVNIIYSDDYGSEIEDLIKQRLPRDLLRTEVERIIVEALIYDERIESVDRFTFTFGMDSMLVEFMVTTVQGEQLNERTEVSV